MKVKINGKQMERLKDQICRACKADAARDRYTPDCVMCSRYDPRTDTGSNGHSFFCIKETLWEKTKRIIGEIIKWRTEG